MAGASGKATLPGMDALDVQDELDGEMMSDIDDAGGFSDDDLDMEEMEQIEALVSKSQASQEQELLVGSGHKSRRPRSFYEEFKRTLGQGDLTGFQFFWGVISVGFFAAKMGHASILDNVEYYTIIVVPILNFILTGTFDYLIMKHRNPANIESPLRLSFAALFLVKFTVGTLVFYFWLYAKGDGNAGFIDRYMDDTSWSDTYCGCEVGVVFVSCILALAIGEMIITTNIV